MERINISLNPVIRIAPEIILQVARIVRKELHQLPLLLPLGPLLCDLALRRGAAGSVVRIEVIHKVGVVALDALAGVVGQDAVEHLEQIGAVEGAQDRGAEVVRGEVGPGGHGGVDGHGGVEEDAPGQSENQVAEDGGQTLEARVDLVKNTRAEGRAGRQQRGVGRDESLNLRLGCVVEEDVVEVADQLGGGGDVALEEREERSLVLLVADDHGHRGVLLLEHKLIGALGEDLAVGTGEVGESDRGVRQDRGHGVSGLEEGVVGESAEAGQGVSSTRAAGVLDDGVVDLLALGAVDGVGGDDRARVHDGAAEKRLAVVLVVTVEERHLVEDGDGAGRLAPDGDLVRVTAKGSNVVGNPLETHTLVEVAQVGRAILKDLLSGHETESTDTVVDGNVDVWLTHVDSIGNQGSAIVHGGPSEL